MIRNGQRVHVGGLTTYYVDEITTCYHITVSTTQNMLNGQTIGGFANYMQSPHDIILKALV